MRSFESFSHARDETRRILRDRLGRALRPMHEHVAGARNSAGTVTDVELLELLTRARIGHDNEAEKVRAAYEAHRSASPGMPTFDDLVDEGWFGVAWGRVTTELNTRTSVRQQDEPLRTGLQIIFDTHRCEATFAFGDVSGLSQASQQLSAQLAEHPEDVTTIPAPSPDWIAARLWERRPQVSEAEALRWWVDRWRLLGKRPCAPTAWWTEEDSRAWRLAAFDLLRRDPGLVGWDRERTLLNALLSHERGRVPSPDVPPTVVERYLWLNGGHVDHWGRALESCGDTWVALAMLCEDLVARDRALESPSAAELLDLVVERPTLLALLAIRVQQRPALLADLLLHAATAPLACLMVADWVAQPIGGWERSLQDADNAAARERAFADAVSITTHHFRAGGGSVQELAALLVWLHGQVLTDAYQPPHRSRKISANMLEVARRGVQALSKPQLKSLLNTLSFRESDGLGTPRFTAALDVATVSSLSEALSAEDVVASYVAALLPDAVPDSIGLTPAQAASLVLAARSSKAWGTFLAPIDVRARLAKSKDAENEFTARGKLARALRAHIRVLARAISAWDGIPPDDLVDALASSIRAGCCDHFEKGRVSAFAARYEAGVAASPADPPLVDDIAAACTHLRDPSRHHIDEALMLVDEPLALAHLMRRAPIVMRDKVKARVEALTPNDAATVYSLTEVQGRIDALLSAGATTAAAKYMDIERGLETLGQVEGREVARLRWDLGLALLRDEFSRIAQTTVPDQLQPSEVASAQDAIRFYQGLAELANPNGAASTAEALFAGLARQHPENAAYVVNLFAARLSQLLGNDRFRRLSSGENPAARDALSAADHGLERALGVRDDDRRIHELNKALLLLAMGQPSHALQLLERAKPHEDGDTLAAYSAVALARMGRVDEAHATLTAAEVVHGDSVVLKAARDHLDLGSPSRFRLLSVANDDSVASVQSALFQLTQMDPSMQARVVNRETIEAHITEELRSAAAGVTAIVPMIREAHLHEDDVTAFLLRILEARVRFFGWSVPDQSKGGFSAKGNPGERDLVLRKDGYGITVLEAMVCTSNPAAESAQRNLTSHFQKLFGYDHCHVFFHVVYSYVDRPEEVVAAMRSIARSSAPAAFAFSRTDDLPHEDSRPNGFMATYSVQGGGEVKVVSLVMDMLQRRQRDAAALAGQTLTSRRTSDGG